MVTVDRNSCISIDTCPTHGKCVKICALNCISIDENRQIQISPECPDCGLCVMNCPKQALHLNEE